MIALNSTLVGAISQSTTYYYYYYYSYYSPTYIYDLNCTGIEVTYGTVLIMIATIIVATIKMQLLYVNVSTDIMQAIYNPSIYRYQ